jgi:hypothetical protein
LSGPPPVVTAEEIIHWYCNFCVLRLAVPEGNRTLTVHKGTNVHLLYSYSGLSIGLRPAPNQIDLRLLELGPTGTFSVQGCSEPILSWSCWFSPPFVLSSLPAEPTCSWRVHQIWPVVSPQSAIHTEFTKHDGLAS